MLGIIIFKIKLGAVVQNYLGNLERIFPVVAIIRSDNPEQTKLSCQKDINFQLGEDPTSAGICHRCLIPVGFTDSLESYPRREKV